MKRLILIALVLAGLYFYPQFNEGADSPCGALEKRYVRHTLGTSEGGKVLGALVTSGSSDGDLAASFVKNEAPNLPSTLGCLKFYYQYMFEPEAQKLGKPDAK